ncbi:MAG: sigma 54-interacting transcriptional regulator [Acidobacteriota bacterium]
MPLRLIIRLGERSRKVALQPGEHQVGSDPGSTIRLTHPTVSRRHALIRVSAEGAWVEDLASSNGTQLDSRRLTSSAAIEPGSRLAFGSVQATVEEVREGDLKPAKALGGIPRETQRPVPEPVIEPPPLARARTTISSSALESFTLQHLPGLLEQLWHGAAGIELAQTLGAVLYRNFPCLRVELSHGHDRRRVIWFTARSSEPRPDSVATVERSQGELTLSADFFPASLADAYTPIVTVGLYLVALAAHRSPARTAAPAPRPPAPPPLPAPPTVEPALLEIYTQAAQVALGEVGVLIRGESGTGKEVLARYVHAASGRPSDKLVALNCAALPRDLLELELFGIERAVATGVDPRPGKFELADGGTLFLDEIGDMALETQAKILRVLQEREVYRLGGKQPQPARVRVLAATNRDVDAMVEAGTFRSDLYHRIAGWVVELPALRRRMGDLPNLAAHFLAREAEARGVEIAGISQAAMAALESYAWPGNIRELQSEIARASLFLTDGDLLESSNLRPVLTAGLERRRETLRDTLERVERQAIERALAACAGDATAAADRLGVGRSTLYRRMKALGIGDTAER